MERRRVPAIVGWLFALGASNLGCIFTNTSTTDDTVAAATNQLGIVTLRFERGENDLVIRGLDQGGAEIVQATLHHGTIQYVPDIGLDPAPIAGRELVVRYGGMRAFFQRPEGVTELDGAPGAFGVFLGIPEVRDALQERGLYSAPRLAAQSACGGVFAFQPNRADMPIVNNGYSFRSMCGMADLDTWGGLKPCDTDADCGHSTCKANRCQWLWPKNGSCGSVTEIGLCIDHNTRPGVWTDHTLYSLRRVLGDVGTNDTSPPSACDGVNGGCGQQEVVGVDLGPTTPDGDAGVSGPPDCHTFAQNDQFGNVWNVGYSGCGYDYTPVGGQESYSPTTWAAIAPLQVQFTPTYPSAFGTCDCVGGTRGCNGTVCKTMTDCVRGGDCVNGHCQDFGGGQVNPSCTWHGNIVGSGTGGGGCGTTTISGAVGQGCDVPVPIDLDNDCTQTVNGDLTGSLSFSTGCGDLPGQVFEISTSSGRKCFTYQISDGFELGVFERHAQKCGGDGACLTSGSACVSAGAPQMWIAQKMGGGTGTYTLTITRQPPDAGVSSPPDAMASDAPAAKQGSGGGCSLAPGDDGGHAAGAVALFGLGVVGLLTRRRRR
jgi:MYXO-CTERM domain-containing protein